jgi:hypothetical protein
MSEAEPLNLPDMTSRLAHGAKVFVILYKDPLRERIDVRASEVLGLEDDVLFLAQTEPPVSREQIGATLEAALLLETGADLRPVGYASRLLNILEDYSLPDHTQVQALAISAPRPEDFFETSLRMHYRVPVDENMGVLIRLEGLEGPERPEGSEGQEDFDGLEESEGPELLDFSAGGARVRLPGRMRVEVGQGLPFKLVFLGSGYADGIGVVRSVERSPDGSALFLGLFFTNMDIRDIRYLERMVARIVSACRQRERDAEYT